MWFTFFGLLQGFGSYVTDMLFFNIMFSSFLHDFDE